MAGNLQVYRPGVINHRAACGSPIHGRRRAIDQPGRRDAVAIGSPQRNGCSNPRFRPPSPTSQMIVSTAPDGATAVVIRDPHAQKRSARDVRAKRGGLGADGVGCGDLQRRGDVGRQGFGQRADELGVRDDLVIVAFQRDAELSEGRRDLHYARFEARRGKTAHEPDRGQKTRCGVRSCEAPCAVGAGCVCSWEY